LERTRFFARKLDEIGLRGALELLGSLVAKGKSERLHWSLPKLAISDAAWRRVAASNRDRLIYFCHPSVIETHPILITYYRGAALLSQKGMAYAGVHAEGIEKGRVSLSPDAAVTIARLVNRHVSELLEYRDLQPVEVERLAYVALGAQIQGSWNNAVGAGATQNVKRLLVAHWYASGVIASLQKKRVKYPAEPGDLEVTLDSIPDYSGVYFSNGSTAVFASEPDVSLRNPRGTLTGAIEIKGGTDPAGALERLGAAEKSFRAARAESPQHPCKTILLMAAITEEVARRLQAEPSLFNSTYELAELYVNDEKLQAFRREVDEQLWL
jgi:hypothetical protein